MRSNNTTYFNYPINAYPAGSYQYETATAASNRATTNPVTVSYAAGLGMAVNATTGVNSGSATLTGPTNGNNYLTLNGSSTLNDNTSIQVPNSTGAATGETITISGTRPQSVWYTVGQQAEANPANNIYVPDAGKLVGTANSSAVNGGGSS